MEKELYIDFLGDLSHQLYKIKKNTRVNFRPGRCPIPEDIQFQTNYPLGKHEFCRDKYQDLTREGDSIFNWKFSILFEISGSFHVRSTTGDFQVYITVEPDLKVALNEIRCQTVLAKCLGPLPTWRQRLSATKDACFNMIHFTPTQELGQSGSSYSLRDQLKVNPTFEASLNDLRKEVEYMEKKWSILSVTDIVLNHTADDSPWISEHPECAFNLENTPQLRPAFMLDSAFIWLQQDVLSGLLRDITPLITDEQTVQSIGVLLRTFYVPQLKIFEFFMVDLDDAMARFDQIPKLGSVLEIEHLGCQRNSAKVKSMPIFMNSPQELKALILAENKKRAQDIRNQLNYAVENALNAIRYERLNPDGPYYEQTVDPVRPLVAPYFTHTPFEEFKISSEESRSYSEGQLFMAHNGWTMGASQTNTEISPEIYLKRELIAWGDCIKLRYGQQPSDVPFLWDHIRKYVESQARIFHGFRIDNCHSTPIHVAEFVVDIARSIRPDFYIMAELFTQSENIDNLYVNKLGITSLIRESMSAQDSRELGRLMYRYGGTPVGAFIPDGAEPLKPMVANAIFYDQTHDNDSPIKRRTAYDLSATMAIINMADCATGSNLGYDHLVPHHIDVVKETRLYPPMVGHEHGLLPLRRFLNETLIRELQGFNEIFVDQVNDEVLAITRHNPKEGTSIVLVARTAFKPNTSSPIRPISIEGVVARCLIEAQACGDPEKYLRDNLYINGLENFRIVILDSPFKLTSLKQLSDTRSQLDFNEFKFLPSSVLAVEVRLADKQRNCLKMVNSWTCNLLEYDLTLDDCNFILFRCEEESYSTYELPNFTKFTYCGLYGLMYYLEKVRDNQDQAHPLSVNLRSGNWLAKYIVDRLRTRVNTKPLAEHLDEALKHVYELPKGMIPKYFDLIIRQVYKQVCELVYSKMSPFVTKGSRLIKLLALSTVSLVGECDSAPLPPVDYLKLGYSPSIAAGLPHFASGYMRNWGRDTFISMRGLLLVTGRFAEAKFIILSCARTLKHGLIPNLIDGGVKSRYNCRDAVWWWLYCIREYTRMAPNGIEILRCTVRRLHTPERNVNITNGTSSSSDSQYLYETIQEALECHFKGMDFVEENAGKQLDEHMTDEGFRIKYGTRPDTGFVYGGNGANCGTWMDKMGSSVKANTKGKPASPRDGSAIEIVALCKCVVSWLDEISKLGYYPYTKVERIYDNTITLEWTWRKWASLIQQNFEKCFYIPSDHKPGDSLINRRGIYKDTFGATLEWQDNQFRPNFLIACVISPELFDAEHAEGAIKLAKKLLCGPMGIKTLDPSDWNYQGDYDNDNRSSDPKVAHGYNYHQGPEWLWLTGYYIRASVKFLGPQERSHHLKILSNIYNSLLETPWLGLPELTNSNGKFCKHSCSNQAWSLGTMLEALYESIRT